MTPKSRILNYPAILVALALLTIQGTAISQETASYFKQNCISCHTIGGGRLTGPDLKNVTQAKDRAWLSRFIVDPRAMLDAGDQYALDLQKDARGAVMPALPGMTRQRAEALLDLIDAESKLEKSQFIGVQISDRPLTQRDLDLGRELFLGTLPLNGGGPSCLSCHSVHGINGLWGVLSVGIFANGAYGAGWNGVVRDEMVKLYGSDGVRGLLYGDFSQFVMQAIDCAVVAGFGFAMAYVWFKLSNLITPIRVSREVELEGLDGPEMGVLGYPDFQLHPSGQKLVE